MIAVWQAVIVEIHQTAWVPHFFTRFGIEMEKIGDRCCVATAGPSFDEQWKSGFRFPLDDECLARDFLEDAASQVCGKGAAEDHKSVSPGNRFLEFCEMIREYLIGAVGNAYHEDIDAILANHSDCLVQAFAPLCDHVHDVELGKLVAEALP
jgi:hypothetical protein